jgi:hypothetical protein
MEELHLAFVPLTLALSPKGEGTKPLTANLPEYLAGNASRGHNLSSLKIL